MKRIQTTAIILKRLNFGEADRILTVITPDQGKLSLLAKGVRRPKSKLAGGLELFSVTNLTFIEGKSDLKTIVSTRLDTHFKHIVGDVERTMIGYDFLKLIDNFSDHTDQAAYHDVLVAGLAGLDDENLDQLVVQSWFYVRVLAIFGSNINVEKPLNSDKFDETSSYHFSYDDMSFYADRAGQFAPNHIKFLRLVVRADEPARLSSITNAKQLAKDLAQTIKQAAFMHKA